jgi:hypothetical protein
MPYGSLGVGFCIDVFVVQVLIELEVFCRTPNMSKMHHDGNSNLKEVAEVLEEYMGYVILFLIPCLMIALVMDLSLEDRWLGSNFVD